MASKAIWKGMLSVGPLLNVPVKLYKAADDYTSGLREIHSECKSPLTRDVHCATCNKSVPHSDIFKGALQPDGTYVVLSQDELKGIKPETSLTLSVMAFVPLATVDPLYIDDVHYLAPDGAVAVSALALLSEALTKQKRVGQTRFTMHGRERTVTLRPFGSLMVLQSMRDENHVRAVSELPGYIANVKPDVQALHLAERLIDVYAESAFDPSEYEDSNKKALTDLIEAKKNGTAAPVAATTAAPQPARDLMAALKASLASAAPPKKAMAKVHKPQAVAKQRTKKKAS